MAQASYAAKLNIDFSIGTSDSVIIMIHAEGMFTLYNMQVVHLWLHA